jgi:multicomponent Na+:H+ antiporter subunit G
MIIGGVLICLMALVILLIAAIGVVRLPDALARQHAATKAATLAVSIFAIGIGIAVWNAQWTWKLALVIAILLLTMPLASHALARAGVDELERRSDDGFTE